MKSIYIALMCVFVLVGCKSGKEENEGDFSSYNEGEAVGKVQAMPFTVQSGRTRVHPSGGNQWLIELYSEVFSPPCGVSFPPDFYINFSVDKAVGTYTVHNARAVAFIHSVNGGANIAASTTGEIQIETIENGYVVGRMRSRYDDDNNINGEFWAQICD